MERQRDPHLTLLQYCPTDGVHLILRQFLEDAALGKFDVVVVHTLDRWARNLKVLLETVAILNQYGVGLVSITENLDWSTPKEG